jgi:hypothetical protein
LYQDESDVGPYPFPANVPIEGAYPGCSFDDCPGDRHVLVVDDETCKLYETWQTIPTPSGPYQAGSGAIFNLFSAKLRPLGWTSADAAGLPIAPLLVQYDEVMNKQEIKHAIRMTVPFSDKSYLLPASHYASFNQDRSLPPMGARFRLRSSYDCSSFTVQAQVLCTAMKRYGLIVADNGSPWYVSGEATLNWNFAQISQINSIPASALEAVDTGDKLCLNPECTPLKAVQPLPVFSALLNRQTELKISNNIYSHVSPRWASIPARFQDRTTGASFEGDFAVWKNWTMGDQNSVEADPKLTNLFAPDVGSPAIGLASPSLPESQFDFYGKVRGSADVGAVSSVSSGPVTNPFSPAALTPADPCFGIVRTPGSIYVAKTGNDSVCNPTISTPLRSISRALALAIPGDTILIRSGNYSVAASGYSIKTPLLTLEGYPGETVLIRSSPISLGADTIAITNTANNVTLKNLEVVGGYVYSISVAASFVKIENCKIHGSGTAAVAIIGASFVEVSGTSISYAGQRVPRLGDGFFVSRSSHVSLKDNHIYSCRSTAIHVRDGSRFVTVERNYLLNNVRGISLGNDNAQKDTVQSEAGCPWLDAATDPVCHTVYSSTVKNNIIVSTHGLCFSFSVFFSPFQSIFPFALNRRFNL